MQAHQNPAVFAHFPVRTRMALRSNNLSGTTRSEARGTEIHRKTVATSSPAATATPPHDGLVDNQDLAGPDPHQAPGGRRDLV